MADHLLTQVGPGKTDIVKPVIFSGMPSSSILEPMVYLYRKTGDKRYLDFAKYIVEQWETPDGPKLISKLWQAFLFQKGSRIHHHGGPTKMDRKLMR